MRMRIDVDGVVLTITGFADQKQQTMKATIDLMKANDEDQGTLQKKDIERLRNGFLFVEIDE